MDNNNNQITTNIVTLPLYIIKQILKILCGFINYNNKLIETIGQIPNQKTDYRENETDIKTLMMSIALVSKLFFQTLSNNLYASVDFNYRRPSLLYGTENSKKYSIVKLENVKTLKLHYEHDPGKDYFYRMLQTKQEIPIEQSYIDREMGILVRVNLKKLKLRNIKNTNVDLSKLLSLFVAYKDKIAISLLEVEINENTTQQQLMDIHETAKKTFSLIVSCGKKEIILQSFKLWSEKLYQLYITSPPQLNFNFFKTLAGKEDGYNINYLKNLVFIETYGFELRLIDLQYVLSPLIVPRLNTFSVNVCFDKLVYMLSTVEERKSQLRKCPCNSLVFDKSGTHQNQDDEITEFEENWSLLQQLFKSNSTIRQITFGHECKISGGIFKTRKQNISTSFYQKFAELISSVVNLRKFIILGINAPKLIQKVIKFNQNKSIVHFEAGVVLQDDYREFITSLESLTIKYPHVQTLKFTEYIFKINKYEQSVLFDFKR